MTCRDDPAQSEQCKWKGTDDEKSDPADGGAGDDDGLCRANPGTRRRRTVRLGEALGYPAGGKPPPPPPDYAFENGKVVVSGDLVIGCREFAKEFDEGYDEYGDQTQAERVLERCKQAGLPALPIQIPAEVRQEIRQDALPETGGVSLPLLTTGLLLVGAGLLTTCRRIR